MIIHGIHHVRLAVLHPNKIARLFIERFKFEPSAIETRNSHSEDRSIVLKHGNVTFILCKRSSTGTNNNCSDSTTDNILIKRDVVYDVDTICDISFKADLSSTPNTNRVRVTNFNKVNTSNTVTVGIVFHLGTRSNWICRF